MNGLKLTGTVPEWAARAAAGGCWRAGSLLLLLCMAIALAALSGCQRGSADGASPMTATASPVKPDLKGTSSVAVDSVNYRHDRSMAYTLLDLTQNPPRAVGGENVDPLMSGGSKGCCLALPNAWRPGLKVRVEWTESDRKQIYPEKYTRDLEVPRYEQPADLFVVFYPGHDVEVVTSYGEPGHPQWAGRVKSTPWAYCMANSGRKACKDAMPKLFDVEGSQGYCTYLKEDNPSKLEDNCAFATMECMRDYEDEGFCKKLLWGPRRKGL